MGQNNNSADSFENTIVGESEELKKLLELSARIASSDAAVLINGESGTGKELLARYIQKESKRADNKFVVINCAAIPNELLENELFGHKKGAFTDATEDYVGKFGYANGGTVFLDEIAEMSLNLQAKLLRILQFKEYEMVGSTDLFKTDIRIIAATNKDLYKLIKKNKFREDLFYRLNVVPLKIPSLRERGSDIEVLANYFLKMYNQKNNKEILGFSSGVMSILEGYDWPGNVRQLQNVIERAVVLCAGEYIGKNEILISEGYSLADSNEEKSLKDAINNFKKDFIIKSLEKNSWNQTKTAKDLKIQRTYLSRLIKELSIDKL